MSDTASDGPAHRFSVRAFTLRAFDLSERTARYGRRSADERVTRWRSRAFMIGQCAITAGLAWALARGLFHHPAPFFAPVAAIITLGFSFGQRLRRAIEVAIGVAVGVGVGDVFVHVFGTGVWQIVLVCAVAMSLATLLGAGNLMIIQAGVQSIIVTTLLPGTASGVSRWVDAVVGCGLAVIVATIAPSSPVRKPLLMAAAVLRECEQTLRSAEQALREHDPEAADAVLARARASEEQLDDLSDAATEGLAVVRSSPFRRGQRRQAQAYADLSEPLDRLTRNLRVLARRAYVAAWRGNEVPDAYRELMVEVADLCEFMANEMYERRLPVAARDRLAQLGASSLLPVTGSLSSVVILAQLRSMLVDLLQLIGVDPADAREAIPDLD